MIKYLFSIIIITVVSCATEFDTRKLVYSTRESAFYTIQKKDIPKSNYIDTDFNHPYDLKPEVFTGKVIPLKFSKRTRIGNFKDNIFHPNELETLSRDISQVIAVVKSNEAIIVISGYDHIQSVVSNYKRTTFYLWIDKNGMNIVFGDIQDDTSKEASRNFYEYTQIKPISLAVSPDENEVLEDKSFSFKKVEGFTNRKWLVFSLDTTPSTLPPAKL